MSDNEQEDEPDGEDQLAEVYDLVEYKIADQLNCHAPGTPDWQALFNVLELYLGGTIDVKWTGDDMLISMRDGSEIKPEILFPSDEEK
tara:strand:+ start:1401 stop:1664 length:264 start_codon:yes stop_codon:yes gene_type:complete